MREGEREQEAAKTHKIQIFRPEASFKSSLAAAAAVETLNYIVASFFPLQLNPTQKSHFGRRNVLFNGAQAEAGTADEGASKQLLEHISFLSPWNAAGMEFELCKQAALVGLSSHPSQNPRKRRDKVKQTDVLRSSESRALKCFDFQASEHFKGRLGSEWGK